MSQEVWVGFFVLAGVVFALFGALYAEMARTHRRLRRVEGDAFNAARDFGVSYGPTEVEVLLDRLEPMSRGCPATAEVEVQVRDLALLCSIVREAYGLGES